MPSGTHSIKYLKNILINALRIANIKYDYIYHQPLQDLPLIPHPPNLVSSFKKKNNSNPVYATYILLGVWPSKIMVQEGAEILQEPEVVANHSKTVYAGHSRTVTHVTSHRL